MGKATAPLTIGFNVPFSEAIKAAESRNVLLPDVYYGQLQGLARQQAFSIAGIASLDQLQAVKDSLDEFMRTGGSFNAWKKKAAVLDLNLPAHRLDNIWRTNLQGNYMRGHWEQFVRNAESWPYLMYDAINDSRVRPSHLAHDGVIRPVGDQFWQTHSPPMGYRCRCNLIALSEEQAQARSGFDRNGKGTGLNKVPELPDGGGPAQPDKGWDYNPYEDQLFPLRKALERFDPKLRAVGESILEQAKVQADQLSAQYWDANLPQAVWHDKSFIDAPIELKKAIQAHDYKLQNVITGKGSGTLFSVEDMSINMGINDMSSYKGQKSWRHEYGHFLDNAIGTQINGKNSFRSSNDDFRKAMRHDMNAAIDKTGARLIGQEYAKEQIARSERVREITDSFMNASDDIRNAILEEKAKNIGHTINEIVNFIERETTHTGFGINQKVRINRLLSAIAEADPLEFMDAIHAGIDYREKMAIYKKGQIGSFSDLFGSGTRNMLLGNNTNGNGGHETSYYKKAQENDATEVFANLTALLGNQDSVWLTILNKMTPRLVSTYMEILNAK